ncbi:hypothetical protein QJS10_CPB19g01731 [Acorus calamus]|uniref:EF-hand domain-containing protein n=1 Tax=Acorus calamus TaxID=4465 RepID=A0AAV9CKT0_ACOCL|nr:hypothetical protein QJS10_CPB19g01731 [Acorus calamus]
MFAPSSPMEDQQSLKCWLDGIDTNKDRKISKEELRKALHDLGLHFTHWRVWHAMARADLNHNHCIDGHKELDVLYEYAKKHWETRRHRH